MGISGLLPALKPIQKTKHLSEFKGQTIAVDAYVWLHKGVYTCAMELATGKPTHRYVDYAMHRIRLLRHFHIEPFIVFDGGPLPAKKDTESERKQRREENLSRAKALTAQGKHSQARDCFLKCVDVTPQMAYQFIKALRAENVQYVVAPYEADAQLAYLECVGLVSAILTEDSDLLVFGCKNVLFKFDHVASTVCHISRSDFGSVGLDSSAINLHGWSDTQFRAMAILSGCDYLSSIPGIGLKTANNLLRKWKTAEAVVRAVMLEGKKNVPSGYMKQFTLAEKCFRFQRVYDPVQRKLVHLSEVEGEWDEEADAYVGKDMEPELATAIALGNIDPVTGQPMKDINPSFKPLPKASGSNDKSKQKAVCGILNFFGPNPIVPREKSSLPKANVKSTLTGTSSGTRRLGELMDHDLANRKQHKFPLPYTTQSKFFSEATPRRVSASRRFSKETTTGSSQIPEDIKENICITISDDDEEEILTTLSMKANISPTQDLDFDFAEAQDGVEQEDGYMSPLSTYSPGTQDLSSPDVSIFTPLKKKKRKSFPNSPGRPRGQCQKGREGGVEVGDEHGEYENEDFDVDPISSPVTTIKRQRRRSCSLQPKSRVAHNGPPLQTPIRSFSAGDILVPATDLRKQKNRSDSPDSLEDILEIHYPAIPKLVYDGPDLQSCLGGDDEEVESEKDELVTAKRAHDGVAATHNSAGLECGHLLASDLGSGSGQDQGYRSKWELGLNSKSGFTSPLSPSPQTPIDDVNANVTVSGGGISGELEESTVFGVDVLEADIVEMEAEIETMQTEMALNYPEENAMKMQAERLKRVAKGWRKKWALGQLEREDSSSSSSPTTDFRQSLRPKSKIKKDEEQKKRRQSAPMSLSISRLRRNEFNVTPLGKHSLANNGTNRPIPHQRQQNLVQSDSRGLDAIAKTAEAPLTKGKNANTCVREQRWIEKRSSLIFTESKSDVSTRNERGKVSTKAWAKLKDEQHSRGGYLDDDEVVELSPRARTALSKFRYQ